MKLKNILLFLLLITINVSANEKFDKIINKAEYFENIDTNLAKLPKLNIRIENCYSFPYFHINEIQTKGNVKIYNDFLNGLKTANKCFSNSRSHNEIKIKYNELLTILLNNQEKILKCIIPQSNSVYAVASVRPGHKKDWVNDFFGLPTHPSILFHTNTIAGNFPLSMSEKDINEKRKEWGTKYKDLQIGPGLRNPDYTKIQNTSALVFHEMFHWPENFHNDKKSLDIVKLSEFCCFDNPGHSQNFRDAACNMLYDKKAWQPDLYKRLKYIKENKIFKKFKEINKHFDD